VKILNKPGKRNLQAAHLQLEVATILSACQAWPGPWARTAHMHAFLQCGTVPHRAEHPAAIAIELHRETAVELYS
jgi:hypothetical protein